MCDMSVLDGAQKLASSKLIGHVYDYWNRKRTKLGKALIRRFQPPTSINDMSEFALELIKIAAHVCTKIQFITSKLESAIVCRYFTW